ncbi:MAG: hypothetical protein EBR86_11065, partial [Planctomycetia bacterium]|nr:hypothetical protein [Planctomycetia bacterium]
MAIRSRAHWLRGTDTEQSSSSAPLAAAGKGLSTAANRARPAASAVSGLAVRLASRISFRPFLSAVKSTRIVSASVNSIRVASAVACMPHVAPASAARAWGIVASCASIAFNCCSWAPFICATSLRAASAASGGMFCTPAATA